MQSVKLALGALAAACLVLAAQPAVADPSVGTSTPVTLAPPRLMLSPATQRGVPNSWSQVEKSVGLPAAGSLEIAYFVDSEAGYDFFTIVVDGYQRLEESGPGRSAIVSVPVAAGLHTVAVRYTKDYSVDSGLDRAGILWITRRPNGHPIEVEQFRQFGSLASTSGFTTSSSGLPATALWTVSFPPALASAARPRAHSVLGTTGTTTVSAMSRSMLFAAEGALDFDYFVDTELRWDHLRVSVDGTPVFKRSGANDVGHGRIPVAAGLHLVAFEYVKDGSIDSGGDVVRVDNILASSGGKTFEAHDCNGRLGTLGQGWTRSGTGGGFLCERPTPVPLYVPPFVAGGSTPGPVCDGSMAQREYGGGSIVVPDIRATSAAQRPAELTFASDTRNQRTGLHWVAKVPRPAIVGGSHMEGTLVMHAGNDGGARRHVRAPCPGLWTAPGTRDYELTVRYRLSSTGEVTITDRTVRVGTCGGAQPWSAAVLDQPWLIEMVGGVVPGDTGSYLLEGRLSAPTSGLISPILSISWTNTLRNGGTQTFPLPPPERVYSWPVRGEIDGPDLAADASSWQPVAFLPSPSPGSLPLSESAVSER